MHETIANLIHWIAGFGMSAILIKIFQPLGAGGFFNQPLVWVKNMVVGHAKRKEEAKQALQVHIEEDEKRFDKVAETMASNDRNTIVAIGAVGEVVSNKLESFKADIKGDFSD